MDRLSAKLASSGLSSSEVQAKLGLLIKQQSAILGINDAFLVASALFIGLSAWVWLAHPTTSAVPATAEDRWREARGEGLVEEMP